MYNALRKETYQLSQFGHIIKDAKCLAKQMERFFFFFMFVEKEKCRSCPRSKMYFDFTV